VGTGEAVNVNLQISVDLKLRIRVLFFESEVKNCGGVEGKRGKLT